MNSAPLAKLCRIQWVGYIKYTKEVPQGFYNVLSPSVCKDNNCDIWRVNNGYCHWDSIEYFQTNCRKTCGLCLANGEYLFTFFLLFYTYQNLEKLWF